MSAVVPSRLRVLQVITDTDRRGAQVFAIDLQDALRTRGHEVETVALGTGDVGGLDVEVLAAGRAAKSPHTMVALRRRAAGRDALVAHGSTTLPVSAIAMAASRVPVTYRQISDSRFWAPTVAKRVRTGLALRSMDHVTALYEGAAADLTDHLRLPPDRITVVPNGVPPTTFDRPTEAVRQDRRSALGVNAATVVAYVGALVREKGVDRAIRAVAAAEDCELIIAGDGPERLALETLARSLAAPVTFLGRLDAPAAVYAAADIVVLPSRGGDSMPASLIEAGLCALPVVTTDVAGIPAIVVDGVTGAVTPHDDDERFIEAMVDMIDSSRAERSLLGDQAEAHCRATFTIDAVAEVWEQVLLRTVRPAR